MKLHIDGEALSLKNIETARVRDVIELQEQTGLKLPELRERIRESEAFSVAVLAFLSMRASGIATTWDEVQDRGLNEFAVVYEPGDIARQQPEDEAPDPQQAASEDSSLDADGPDGDWPPRAE